MERLASFAGEVALTLEGTPPTGVQAQILSASGVNELSLQIGDTAEVKTSSLTVKGTSGALTQTASLELNVVEAINDFEFSQTNPITLERGSNKNFFLSINRDAAFNAEVNVNLSGLPEGVTATPRRGLGVR
ncbi:MAG: hypothetical protein HC933_09440 [Pleurocapsa sp. SU_196_0]|nr:hypothetical protein [Pleurocapsa sp. SU_196_0]